MKKLFTLMLGVALASFPFSFASAAISVTEIMYDLEGSDTDREWVEIFNDGNQDVDLTGWKLDDGATSKHVLNSPPKNGGQGTMILSPGGYLVLADNALVFISEHPNYSGTVIDTLIELANTKDIVALLDADGVVRDLAEYDASTGAKGDGNSLQKSGGSFSAMPPTPGTGVAGGEASSGGGEAPQTQIQDPPPPNSGTSWPVEPQVFANAGPDRIAVVGADVTFIGKALGLEKKPLENARYVWNFGDGATKEGSAVTHAYHYPGDYIVVLDVSSGYFMGTDRARIQVEKSKISITSLGAEGGRFVELSNGSSYEIDISGWMLREGTVIFVIPVNSFIGGGKKITLPYEVTSIPQGTKVELLYPNGSLAAAYAPAKAVSPADTPSISRNQSAAAPVIEKAVRASAFEVVAAEAAEPEGEGMPDAYKWLFMALVVAAIAGAGAMFLPKPHPSDSQALSPKDFTITEID